MTTLSRALAPRRRAATITVALVGALLLAAPSGAQEPVTAEAEAGIWITLGADAFESLVVLPDLRFALEPLTRVAETSGVVLTRVHAEDIARISNELHREHRRCAGFMAHPSLARAEREMARLAETPPQNLGGIYTIDQAARVQSLEAALDKPQLLATIQELSENLNNRFHAHADGTAAAHWLRDQWLGFAAGRSYVTVELYSHFSTIQPSVIFTIEGFGIPDEVVVLGAHLDSIAFPGSPSDPNYLAPGADDDASGVAVLSEVIRVAMLEGYRPQRTVQFMAYAAEEVGLVGSGEIADDYQAAGVDVVGVFQLDMTAYVGSALDVGVLDESWTDSALTTFVTELLDAYQPELNWSTTACGYGCSDHASWDAVGYPAAMAFESLFGEHNPQIHSTGDTLANLGNNVDHAFKFARLATAFMVEVSKEANVDIFTDGFESGDTSAWSVVVP